MPKAFYKLENGEMPLLRIEYSPDDIRKMILKDVGKNFQMVVPKDDIIPQKDGGWFVRMNREKSDDT